MKTRRSAEFVAAVKVIGTIVGLILLFTVPMVLLSIYGGR